MGVSFDELRQVCQKPVAAGNDVAGLLFGDRLSLPLTKLFVDRGWSPNIATVGMLVCGLLGAVLQLLGPWPALIGAAVLLLYYVLDCVDGEVARWRRIEHARWGYYEYIFHFVVKPLAFAAVGVAVYRQTGQVAALAAAFAAGVATLWLKLFFAVPSLVFVGAVLRRGASGERPYSEYIEEAADQVRAAGGRVEGREGEEVFRLAFDRVTLRSMATNFDVGLALLVLASAADLALGEVALFGVQGLGLRALWLAWYGVVLPIDFVDYVRSYVSRRHFDQSMVRLLARAHGFAVEPDDERGEGQDGADQAA